MKTIPLLFLVTFLGYGCVTRSEIEAAIWLNNFNYTTEDGAPTKLDTLCEKYPEIKDYGFYRKLNNGKIEFMSICNKGAREFFAETKTDFNELVDKALPKQPEGNQ